jgi:hypothetical protein
VRRLWSVATRGRNGGRPLQPEARAADDQDPVHYALIISGTMIMAFAILIFSFTTVYGS